MQKEKDAKSIGWKVPIITDEVLSNLLGTELGPDSLQELDFNWINDGIIGHRLFDPIVDFLYICSGPKGQRLWYWENPGVARGLVVGTHGWPPECPVGTSKDGDVSIKLEHSRRRRSRMQQYQHVILA